MKRRMARESGFTLLELIISLAMVAVLVTACLMAVRLATASREAGTQKADMHQRLRVLHERLHSTLRSTHLIFISPESQSLLPDDDEEKSGDSRILAFEGKPESLKFVTFSEPLINGESSPWMHEVRFYLKKNEDTDSLEIFLNERPFSQKDFFAQESQGLEKGQTLLIAQDVAYLKFRYYYELSEDGGSEVSPEEKPVKVSGVWADKIITEPFDFKSNIGDNKITDTTEETIRLPRVIEVSAGLWQPGRPEEGVEPYQVELPPTIIPIQTGLIFKRLEEEEDSGAPEE